VYVITHIFLVACIPVVILLHLFPDIGRPSAVAGEQRMCRLQIKVSGPIEFAVVLNMAIDDALDIMLFRFA
jgi:hypothetical protein